ncbi:NUDIX domain-containing protein [Chryseomicrobium palamuruense]|uniref:NUDIX domain-containing protein n=1 Tax=Chryseomicrobium palamuruense TaxID=682973 RepID=A0ABV8V0G2_9BACL
MTKGNPIRNSAKSLIVRDQHLLLIKKQDDQGIYYIFPGGGQEKGETLEEAVHRECLEEIDAKVNVYELAYVREYIGKNHEFSEVDGDVHQLEFYFHCEILETSINGQPTQPDVDQIGVEWLPIDRLTEYRIYPKAMVETVRNESSNQRIYLGDVN